MLMIDAIGWVPVAQKAATSRVRVSRRPRRKCVRGPAADHGAENLRLA
jgi:hypothetical protein